MTSGVIVRMKHIRQAKLCSSGTREWWRRNDLAWQDFLDNGIPEEELLKTGDPMALRAVEMARKDHGK